MLVYGTGQADFRRASPRRRSLKQNRSQDHKEALVLIEKAAELERQVPRLRRCNSSRKHDPRRLVGVLGLALLGLTRVAAFCYPTRTHMSHVGNDDHKFHPRGSSLSFRGGFCGWTQIVPDIAPAVYNLRWQHQLSKLPPEPPYC